MITVFVLESASLVIIYRQEHAWHYRMKRLKVLASRYDRLIRRTLPTAGFPSLAEQNPPTEPSILALHPYLGYVYNYERQTPLQRTLNNRYGFFGDRDVVYRKTNVTDYVIAVLGGSVAAHMCARADLLFQAQLSQVPGLRGHNVIVIPICQGGYKQPQQTLALCYFLSLGLELDMVVNIDGVNDLLWYYHNYRRNHIEPSFPYNWSAMAAPTDEDGVVNAARRRIQKLRARQAAWTVPFLRYHLFLSATGYLIWSLGTRHNEGLIARAETLIADDLAAKGAQGRLSYQQTGPFAPATTTADEDILAEAAALWRRSSLLLHAMAQGWQVPYLHFLQPNQYFPGSKTLSPYERDHFYNTNSIYYVPLDQGYSLLLREGDCLSRQGVCFRDLSGLFQKTSAEIYEDDCCHYNDEGNQILATAVARAIGDYMAATNRY